jgi:hypothetical protein
MLRVELDFGDFAVILAVPGMKGILQMNITNFFPFLIPVGILRRSGLQS